MTNKIQTDGYVTGFRVGEMILENGAILPIIEFEYRPHPTSPDQEAMNVQLSLRTEVADRVLQGLQRKIDEIADRKAAMN
jgi:hypothetical protein